MPRWQTITVTSTWRRSNDQLYCFCAVKLLRYHNAYMRNLICIEKLQWNRTYKNCGFDLFEIGDGLASQSPIFVNRRDYEEVGFYKRCYICEGCMWFTEGFLTPILLLTYTLSHVVHTCCQSGPCLNKPHWRQRLQLLCIHMLTCTYVHIENNCVDLMYIYIYTKIHIYIYAHTIMYICAYVCSDPNN